LESGSSRGDGISGRAIGLLLSTKRLPKRKDTTERRSLVLSGLRPVIRDVRTAALITSSSAVAGRSLAGMVNVASSRALGAQALAN
jgi:hypothetical protein